MKTIRCEKCSELVAVDHSILAAVALDLAPTVNCQCGCVLQLQYVGKTLEAKQVGRAMRFISSGDLEMPKVAKKLEAR